MISPRWKKVLSDLWSNKSRTLLVALSIAVGVFAVGSVSGIYFLLQEDVSANYMSANPHSGQIYASPFDDDLIEIVSRVDGVKDVSGSSSVSGQVVLASGDKGDISIRSIPQLNMMVLDKLKLEQGSSDLVDKEVYIERGAQQALGVKPGDTIQVSFEDGRVREIRVAGMVHDVTADPYSLGKMVYAYATPETMNWLGGTSLYNVLKFSVSERPFDEEHIRQVAKSIEDKIHRGGREIFVTVIFRPGQHPAQSTLDAVFALLGGMGVLALFLSMFLVVNTINALLSQQVRHIGVMKAVGATMGQVAGMYMGLILMFGVVALILSIPLSALVSYLLASGITQLLNVDLSGFRIPTAALMLEIFIGLGVPFFAGLIPVINGARLTVREAINSYGLSAVGSQGWFDRMIESVRGLPRPLLLSLRNTFRRKARLTLTLFTLVLGGAIFIAVFNLQASLYEAIDVTLGYILSDVNVVFQRDYRIERVRNVVYSVPGVVGFEGWGNNIAQVTRDDGKPNDQVQLYSLPSDSKLISPVLTAGRWLVAEDQNAIVVGNHFIKLRPDVKVGDTILLKIGEKEYPFQVVGIFQMAGNVLMPIVYGNYDYVARLQNTPDQVSNLRIITDRHDPFRQAEVLRALEKRFKEEGFMVGSMIPGSLLTEQNRITIDILIYLLLFMAILIAIVGGLGLMGTMSMNVMERTREIGVMRSIGAVNGAIMQLVIVEGMMIGLISWVLGALLSTLIAKGMGYVLGVTLLNVPLDYRFSMQGLVMWLILVVFLSALSCIVPARNAVRLTIRDVLAYE